MLSNIFIFLSVFSIFLFVQCSNNCESAIENVRGYYKDDTLIDTWIFHNDNHYLGDSVLHLFANGDICSSTTSSGCNSGGGSFGAWYSDTANQKVLFVTCLGINDGTIIQQASFIIENDTILKLYDITHSGGIFGRDTNIMFRLNH